MNSTGMIAMLVYLVVACSQLKMRRKLESEGREIRLKMWLFPWLTYLVIVFIVVSLVVMLFVDQYRPLVLSTGFAALVIVRWHLGTTVRHAQEQGGFAADTRTAGLSASSADLLSSTRHSHLFV